MHLLVSYSSSSSFYAYLRICAAVKDENQPSLYAWSCLGSMSGALIVPSTQDALAAAQAANVDVVVYTLLTRPLALTIADKLHAKCCYVHLQPQVPTALFPHHRNHKDAADGIVSAAHSRALDSMTADVQEANLDSYWAVERCMFKVYHSAMNAERNKAGLSSLSYDDICVTAVGERADMIIANAFPQAVVPHVSDLQPVVYAVGPLADAYMPPSWEPPVELEQYLLHGSAPVCIGFGSMRLSGEEERVTRLVYTALRAAGVLRAVVVGGVSGIGSNHLNVENQEDKELVAWADTHVFHAGAEVPYAWLLPHCCAMLCHGGAGVMSAALRGGAGLVVCPVLADQFMWGCVLDTMELGAFAGPSLAEVTMDILKGAIEKAVGEVVQRRVVEVQKQIQGGETGVGRIVELLNGMLSGAAAS